MKPHLFRSKKQSECLSKGTEAIFLIVSVGTKGSGAELKKPYHNSQGIIFWENIIMKT